MKKNIVIFSVFLGFILTANTQTQPIFYENFDTSTFLTSWSQERLARNPSTQTKKWVHDSSFAYEGRGSAKLEEMPVGNINNLISPIIQVPSAHTHRVSFRIFQSSTARKPSEGVKVWVSTSSDTVNGTMLVHALRTTDQSLPATVDGWHQYSATIPIAGNIRLIFQGISEHGKNVYIDEVKVETIPTCTSPSSLIPDQILSDTIKISWTDAVNTSWRIRYRAAGDSSWQTQTSASQSSTLSSLLPNTIYLIRISAICNTTTFSDESNELSIRTTCGAISIFPWKEEFEADWDTLNTNSHQASPPCWTVLDYGAIGNAQRKYYWQPRKVMPLSGNQYAACQTDRNNFPHNDWLISPQFALTGNEMLSFWVRRGEPWSDALDEISVWITSSETLDTITSNDPNNGFVNIYPSSIIPKGEWREVNVDLRNYIGNHRIAFVRKNRPNSGNFICLDDVEIKDRLSCMTPSQIKVSIISDSEINIDSDIQDPDHISWVASLERESDSSLINDSLNALPHIINSLSHSSTYKVAIKAICSNDESSFSDTITFKTPCPPITTLPWIEDFSSYTSTDGKIGCIEWVHNMPDDKFFYLSTEVNFSRDTIRKGRNDTSYVAFGSKSRDGWMFTPGIQLQAGQPYEFSFWFYAPMGEFEFINVYLTSEQTPSGIIQQMDKISPPPTTKDTNFYRYSSIITPELDGVYYFAISTSGLEFYNRGYFCIDDLMVALPPVCPTPQNVNVSDILSSSVKITWSHPNPGTTFSLDYKEISDTIFSNISVSDTQYILTNLTPNTEYMYRLRSHCGALDSSFATSPSSFTTPCHPETIPYLCDFNPSELECWTQERGTLNPVTVFSPDGRKNWRPVATTGAGVMDSHIMINLDGVNINDWFISPPIDLGNSSHAAQVSFDIIRAARFTNTDPPMTPPENGSYIFAVVISTDNGDSWSINNSWIWDSEGIHNPLSAINEQKRRITIPLRDSVSHPYSGIVRIGLYAKTIERHADRTCQLHIDQFSITPEQLCPTPYLISTVEVNPTSVSFAFQHDDATSSWEYEIIELETPFSGISSSNPISSSSFTAISLAAQTNYKIRIRTICDANEYSPWSDSLIFRTAAFPSTIPFQCDFESEIMNESWDFIQQTGTNRWIIGDSAHFGGAKSLYIAPQNSTQNSYDSTKAGTALASIDIQFLNASGYRISFDWRCMGESTQDFLKVFLQPFAQPTPLSMNRLETRHLISYNFNRNPYLNQSATWTHYSIDIDGSIIADSIRKLIFAWRNNASRGTAPPAAIDNISIVPISCGPVDTSRISLGLIDPDYINVDVANALSSQTFLIRLKNNSNNTFKDSIVSYFPVQIPSLPNTEYSILLKTICAAGDSSSFSQSISFRTVCAFKTAPDLEDFSSSPFPCWEKKRGFLTNNAILSSLSGGWRHDTSSLGSAMDRRLLVRIHGTACNFWITSPSILLDSRPTLLNFEVIFSKNEKNATPTPAEGDVADDKFAVVISTDNGATWSSSHAWIWDAQGSYRPFSSLNETKQFISIPLKDLNNNPYTGLVKIAFYVESTVSGGNNHLHIDNVALVPEAICEMPDSLSLNYTSSRRAQFTLDPAPGNASWQYEAVETNANFTESDTTSIHTRSFTIDHLSPRTAYKIRVRSKCSEHSYSLWSDSVLFYTTAPPSNVPFSCDFESDTIANIWNFVQRKGTNRWVIGKGTQNGGLHALYIGDTNTPPFYDIDTTSLSLAFIDLRFHPDSTAHTISFDWKCFGESTFDFLKVFLQNIDEDLPTAITADSNRNALIFDENRSYLNGDTSWKRSNIYLSSAFNTPKRLIFAWKNNESGGINPPASIDNIKVEYGFSCPSPDTLTINNLTPTEATLGWNENGLATSWTIELNGVETTITTNPYTLTQLTPNTSYSVKLKALCSSTIHSSWSALKTFTTPESTPASVITNEATNISANTAELHATQIPGDDQISNKGFEWKETNGTTYIELNTVTEDDNNFKAMLENLTANTTYSFKAYITVNGNKVYGSEKSFRTENVSLSNISKELTSDIQVSPNPAQDKVFIQAQGIEGEILISLLDTQGKVLIRKQVFAKNSTLKTELNLNNMAPGIYYLRFTQGEKTSTQKLIIQ